MSYESIRLQQLEEFLAVRHLTDDFEAFAALRGKQAAALKEPPFEITRVEHHGRRNRNNPVYCNITPWLRTATTEQIEYLISIDPETLPLAESPDTRDVEFLDAIWNACLDEPWNEHDHNGWWSREYYFAIEIDMDELSFVLHEVNPIAYRNIFATPEELGQLTMDLPSKGDKLD